MYQCINKAIPSRKYSIKVPAKWRNSFFILMEISHQRSKWLGPYITSHFFDIGSKAHRVGSSRGETFFIRNFCVSSEKGSRVTYICRIWQASKNIFPGGNDPSAAENVLYVFCTNWILVQRCIRCIIGLPCVCVNYSQTSSLAQTM